MRREGIREVLVRRAEEVFKETKSESRREHGRKFLDGKRSEVGMPVKHAAIQFADGGYREEDGESRLGGHI